MRFILRSEAVTVPVIKNFEITDIPGFRPFQRTLGRVERNGLVHLVTGWTVVSMEGQPGKSTDLRVKRETGNYEATLCGLEYPMNKIPPRVDALPTCVVCLADMLSSPGDTLEE